MSLRGPRLDENSTSEHIRTVTPKERDVYLPLDVFPTPTGSVMKSPLWWYLPSRGTQPHPLPGHTHTHVHRRTGPKKTYLPNPGLRSLGLSTTLPTFTEVKIHVLGCESKERSVAISGTEGGRRG